MNEIAFVQKTGNLGITRGENKYDDIDDVLERSSFIRHYKTGTFLLTKSELIYKYQYSEKMGGKMQEKNILGKHLRSVYSIDMKNEYLVSGGLDGKIKLWNLDSFKEICQFSEFRNHEIYGVRLFLSDSTLVNICYKPTHTQKGITIRDFNKQKIVKELNGHYLSANCCAKFDKISECSNYFITGCASGIIKLWDLRSYENTWKHEKTNYFIDMISILSPTKFAVFDYQQSIKFFDLRNSKAPFFSSIMKKRSLKILKIYAYNFLNTEDDMLNIYCNPNSSFIKHQRIEGSKLKTLRTYDIKNSNKLINRVYDSCIIRTNFEVLLMDLKDREERKLFLFDISISGINVSRFRIVLKFNKKVNIPLFFLYEN